MLMRMIDRAARRYCARRVNYNDLLLLASLQHTAVQALTHNVTCLYHLLPFQIRLVHIHRTAVAVRELRRR